MPPIQIQVLIDRDNTRIKGTANRSIVPVFVEEEEWTVSTCFHLAANIITCFTGPPITFPCTFTRGPGQQNQTLNWPNHLFLYFPLEAN